MDRIESTELIEHGAPESEATELAGKLNECLAMPDPCEAWQFTAANMLRPEHPLSLHTFIHNTVFRSWDPEQGPRPAWVPSRDCIKSSNIAALMKETGAKDYDALYSWSVENWDQFWDTVIRRLNVRFSAPYSSIVDLSDGPESPVWLPDAALNIVESCFSREDDLPAIVYKEADGEMETVSLSQLEALCNRVANGLVEHGFQKGDCIGIDMPMTVEAVAGYLGIIKAGCVVVSIADSFMPEQIATRLRLGKAKAVLTQDVIVRGNTTTRLYDNVVAAEAPRAIVVSSGESAAAGLRAGDLHWEQFLSDDDVFDAVTCKPMDHANILFSSGTTGEPKAIPWNHTTPIKCAADAWLHHNVKQGDVLAWPTNLGWMMGPWLISAALMNGATMALYGGSPIGAGFCKFVEEAGVTMLGVVPSLVSAWRRSGSVKGCNWKGIEVFSSTGECSNASDMFYLMSRAGYRPIIEYCGGTEIGGGYITGTVVQPAAPATFSTPALGMGMTILDDAHRESEQGELYILPPSIGLSTELLNQDHFSVYFKDTPRGKDGSALRKHGDQMAHCGGGYYRAHGRVDDTMNLAGIKFGSAELERIVSAVDGVQEAAAIAVERRGGGATRLVIFAVPSAGAEMTKAKAMKGMREAIKSRLSSAIRVSDVVLVDSLPKTASNKIIRRELRRLYAESRK